ncbi:MAG: phage terminase large subunit family protein [Pseudomonadota bacterium]
MSQWAERYRVLSPEATANHGPWRNDIAPYLVAVMDALSDRETQEVTFVAPSQSGKSEVLLNAMGYFMHQEPSPMIVVQPTTETGEAFSKDRIAPMLRDCAVLGRLVGPARSRDSQNTISSKSYAGGQLDIVGSNAPSGLAMRPKRFVALDERDRHSANAGGEGDVKRIVYARTRSYQRRRKIYEVSSPTDEETSLVWPSYLEGTQEVYEVPCPSCGVFQTLTFERLKWALDTAGKVEPSSVHYECAACAVKIPPTKRGAMLRAGRWTATAVPRVPHKRSFWLHGLCAAFALWEEVAQEFVSANSQSDPAKRALQLRAFFNTTLGVLYKDQQAETQKQTLLARARRYDGGSGDDPVVFHVPRDAGVLTAGVDVQHDRLEVIVRAWGVGETSWLIERAILRGDTQQPAVWHQLDTYRQERTWKHESGGALTIRSMTIDAGDGAMAKRVYEFCAPRLYQHVYAIKGSSNETAPLIPAKPTKVKPGRLYVCGVNGAMDVFSRRLNADTVGTGYVHLNDYASEDYVTQVLSMRRTINPKTRKRRWEATPGVRNEAADCEVYAYLALLLGPVPVASLAGEVARVNADGEKRQTPTPDPVTPTPAPTPKPTGTWLPRRRGWM